MIRAIVLWWSTWSAYPYLGPVRAGELVVAAIAAETPATSAELLIAIARVETHHDPLDVSRMTPAGRRTGRWPSRRPGRGWTGPYFCGLAQARAATWRRCLELQDPATGLAAAATELRRWHHHARGDVRRMLAGHGCGFPMRLSCGSRGGKKLGYPARVMAQLRRIAT